MVTTGNQQLNYRANRDQAVRIYAFLKDGSPTTSQIEPKVALTSGFIRFPNTSPASFVLYANNIAEFNSPEVQRLVSPDLINTIRVIASASAHSA